MKSLFIIQPFYTSSSQNLQMKAQNNENIHAVITRESLYLVYNKEHIQLSIQNSSSYDIYENLIRQAKLQQLQFKQIQCNNDLLLSNKETIIAAVQLYQTSSSKYMNKSSKIQKTDSKGVASLAFAIPRLEEHCFQVAIASFSRKISKQSFTIFQQLNQSLTYSIDFIKEQVKIFFEAIQIKNGTKALFQIKPCIAFLQNDCFQGLMGLSQIIKNNHANRIQKLQQLSNKYYGAISCNDSWKISKESNLKNKIEIYLLIIRCMKILLIDEKDCYLKSISEKSSQQMTLLQELIDHFLIKQKKENKMSKSTMSNNMCEILKQLIASYRYKNKQNKELYQLTKVQEMLHNSQVPGFPVQYFLEKITDIKRKLDIGVYESFANICLNEKLSCCQQKFLFTVLASSPQTVNFNKEYIDILDLLDQIYIDFQKDRFETKGIKCLFINHIDQLALTIRSYHIPIVNNYTFPQINSLFQLENKLRNRPLYSIPSKDGLWPLESQLENKLEGLIKIYELKSHILDPEFDQTIKKFIKRHYELQKLERLASNSTNDHDQEFANILRYGIDYTCKRINS